MRPMKGGQKAVEKLLNRADVQEALYKSGTMTEQSPLHKKMKKKYGSVKDSMGRNRFPEFAGGPSKSLEPNMSRKA